ncbi:MAG: protein serine/threonine phosphatase [Bacteroidetes bacterium]|nr:protein serine/threonine phosphatase [Bacteroidota bacterium]
MGQNRYLVKVKNCLLIFFLFLGLNGATAQNKNYYSGKITQADSLFEFKQDSAIGLLTQILKTIPPSGFDHEIAEAHKSLGRMHYFKADFPMALKHYQSCEEVVERNGFTDIEVQLRNLYGTFYKKQKQYGLALEQFKKGLEIATLRKDSAAIGGLLGDIGLVFAEQNQYAKAKPYFEQGLEIFLRINDNIGASYAYDYLAESFAAEKKFDQAIEYMKKALEIREKADNEMLIAINLNNIGEIYIQNKDYKSATSYLEKSVQISRKIRFADLLQHTLGLLSECYRETGNYKLALEFHEQKNKLKDSIFNERNSQIIQEAEGKYQSQKKQNEIDKLNSQNELNKLEVSKQRSVILSFAVILIIVVIALITIFRYYGKVKKSNVVIRLQQIQTENQKKIIEEKQHEILDSINYAKRIQSTLLAQNDFLEKNLGTDYFVFFQPKDIVSGDFYWATAVGSEIQSLKFKVPVGASSELQTPSSELFYLAVCDSTGHGVPGAFMSLLNIGYLSEAINEKQIREPGEIFNYTRNRLIHSVNKDGQKDGFDGILLKVETNGAQRTISYSAAHNPPVLVSNNKLRSLPYDKMPVGIGEKTETFTSHVIPYEKGDMLYLVTDGYADQFGGPKGKKFKYKQLTELLLTISNEPASRQMSILKQRFTEWKGELEQIDDVCVIGLRL